MVIGFLPPPLFRPEHLPRQFDLKLALLALLYCQETFRAKSSDSSKETTILKPEANERKSCWNEPLCNSKALHWRERWYFWLFQLRSCLVSAELLHIFQTRVLHILYYFIDYLYNSQSHYCYYTTNEKAEEHVGKTSTRFYSSFWKLLKSTFFCT